VSEDSEMEQLLLGREGSVALAASAAIEPRGTVKYKASANGELSLDFVDSQGGDQVVPLDEQRPPSHRSPLQQRERDLTRSLSRTSTATSAAFASLNGSDMQGNLTVTESSAKRQRQPSEIGKW